MSEQNTLGSMMCPNCGKLISANSEKCMHCGTKNPNLWGFSDVLHKFFSGRVSLIPAISTVCIGMYVLSLLVDIRGITGLLSPSNRSLKALGMTGLAAMLQGHWWTLVTAIYLHGPIFHILFNVLWIRQLGPYVEELYGVSRSFLIFTIAGIVGFIFSSYAFILHPRFVVGYTIGASGAIFGLLGALVYYGRKRGGSFGTAIYRQTGQWAIVLFVFGFIFPGVDNFAHAGGFVGGYLSAVLLGFTEIKKENRAHQLMAFGAVGMTAIAFLLAILN